MEVEERTELKEEVDVCRYEPAVLRGRPRTKMHALEPCTGRARMYVAKMQFEKSSEHLWSENEPTKFRCIKSSGAVPIDLFPLELKSAAACG